MQWVLRVDFQEYKPTSSIGVNNYGICLILSADFLHLFNIHYAFPVSDCYNFELNQYQMIMSPKKAPSKPAGASNNKTSATTARKPAASKSTSSKSPVPRKKSSKIPSYEEISEKAHLVYLERMAKGEHGDSDSDWHKAVELLKAGK